MSDADLFCSPDETPRVMARFFIRVGQVARASAPRDPHTGELFSLPMILEAEGVLADDAAHLARGA
jgi:hypothetical protein